MTLKICILGEKKHIQIENKERDPFSNPVKVLHLN